ncbi:MAG TPA: hypothetical protein VJ810_22045 [Blastocatellia bacterium]|nr:hypothetical protein [Blastocatellia bacterium]
MKDRALILPETFFPKCEDPFKWQSPAGLFSLSVIVLFAIVHFAADMLPGLNNLQRPGSGAPSGTQMEYAWIAAKGIAFRISVVLLAIPLVGSFYKFLRSLEPRRLQKALLISFLVFIILSILCFPYNDGGGLRSMGTDYGVISSDPFAVKSGFFYRRLLQPGIANVLGFGGAHLYYLFTMGVTYLLILTTTIAMQRWLSSSLSVTSSESPSVSLKQLGKDDAWIFLVVLSAATASFIAFHFQFPGYPEQIGYICLLIMAFVPMRPQTRWSAVALALASHEIMIFALTPVIVFCFRSLKERAVALAIVGLYGLLWLAAYRFQFPALVSVHTDLAPAVNTIDIFLTNIPWVTLGALAAHKLLWGTLVWVAISLLRQRQFHAVLALASLTLTPLATLVVAADTSRLAGLGFLGILLSIAILCRTAEYVWERSLLRGLLALNVLLPSVYISANYHRIPCPGLYEFVIGRMSQFLG